MTSISSLVERLEAATEGHQLLDLDVYLAVEGLTLCGGFMAERPDGSRVQLPMLNPAYTASIDAALALVERKLPGCMWCVGSMEDGPFCRLLWPGPDGGFGGNYLTATASMPEIAIILALLKSLQAQEGE